MKIEIFKDSVGDWRWRVRATNGRILADSAEGYRNRVDMCSAMERVFGGLVITTGGSGTDLVKRPTLDGTQTILIEYLTK